MLLVTSFLNCGAPTKPGHTTCSRSCAGTLGGKSRGWRGGAERPEPANAACPYCRNGRMERVDGFHIARDGRRYKCGVPQQGGQPRPADGAEPGIDVHAVLTAAVERECAPPWVRHPEPWDNVVRRGASA